MTAAIPAAATAILAAATATAILAAAMLHFPVLTSLIPSNGV
jgi:hypothetical protein